MAKKRPMFWFEEPLDDFRRMQEDFFGNMQKMFRKPWLPSARMSEKMISFPDFKTKFIPVRIGETYEELVLRAELPNFSKDEIKLKITPRAVFIAAEKKRQSVEKNKTFFRVEKNFNSLSRAVSLPEEVRTENVRAKFEDGVLEVIMPKKEKREKNVKIE